MSAEKNNSGSGLALDAGMRGDRKYLYELECVRGLAILLVILFHAWGISGLETNTPGIWQSYIISGSTGVTLFFVLSGFLLSLPWLDRERGEPHIGNYYLARVLRIVPLYYAAVLLAGLLTGQWQLALKAALFQFIGFDMFPYSVVWWTLTTEVQFYLLLPLVGLAVARGGWLRWVMIALGVIWLGAYAWFFVLEPRPGNVMSYWLTKSLFGRLPAFVIGIIAAALYLRLRGRRWDSRPQRAMASAAIVLVLWILGLVLQRAARIGDWDAEWSWHLHHTYEALLWTALVMLLLMGRAYGSGLLVNRPMAVMGKLSYSLYIVHVPLLYFLIEPFKQSMGEGAYTESPWLWPIAILGLGLSVLLSYVTYRLIELPFLGLKRKVSL